MKIVKTTALILIAGLFGLLVFANTRYRSPADSLPKVQLASFNLKGNLTEASRSTLEETVSETLGVAACSINKQGNVASVIFHPDQIDEKTVLVLLAGNGTLEVTRRDLAQATAGGCPVHAAGNSLNAFISSLDFRN